MRHYIDDIIDAITPLLILMPPLPLRHYAIIDYYAILITPLRHYAIIDIIDAIIAITPLIDY
jgi:hypothetical protein